MGVTSNLLSGPRMTNDVESLIFGRFLKVHRDGIELGIRRPGRAGGQTCASLFQLALAEIIGCINEVQFMINLRAFKYLSKPLTLNPRVTQKIEDHRNPVGQEVLDVTGQRISEATRAPDEIRDDQNFAGIEIFQELVLYQEDGILRLR